MAAATPDTFPEGTRVTDPIRNITGTVVGWLRGSVIIRWDVGGTSSTPGHMIALRLEEADAPDA